MIKVINSWEQVMDFKKSYSNLKKKVISNFIKYVTRIIF